MIANKILNVMTKIGPIIKDKTNEEKGFDYASLSAIIIKAREAMIEEKIVMIPLKTEKIVQRENDITISMIYRFYDAEPNDDGNNEYLDVNVPGEGFSQEGWAIYKALSGAYKYAITQTFAIPTIDDAEKDKYSDIDKECDNVIALESSLNNQGGLNENNIEKLLGTPDISEYDSIFDLVARAE